MNNSLKALAKYYDVKYNNSPRYALLQGYTQAVEKGDISPLVGFDVYEKINGEIQEQLIGKRTATGVMMESNTTHFIDRVIGQVAEPHPGKRRGVLLENVFGNVGKPENHK